MLERPLVLEAGLGLKPCPIPHWLCGLGTPHGTTDGVYLWALAPRCLFFGELLLEDGSYLPQKLYVPT